MLEREREEKRGERGESREEVARTLVSCIPEAALSSRPGEKDEKKDGFLVLIALSSIMLVKQINLHER